MPPAPVDGAGVTDAGDHRDDAALLAAHVAGDPAAFGELFARHRDRLYAVALRTAGDPDLAADALQEGLISAFRRAGSFRGDAAVTTWLHRIVVNATLDLHRRHAVRAAESLDAERDEHLHDTAAYAHPGDRVSPPTPVDPADAALVGEQRALVLGALRALPADQRAALVLVDMEGWSVAEAASALGCPAGTVKSRCARGRARLATLLAPSDPAAGSRAPVAGTGNQGASSRVPPPVDDEARSDDEQTERMVPRET